MLQRDPQIDITYPRPQFRRARWIDLCGTWSFAHDDDDRGLAERWFEGEEDFGRAITVPFPPESRLSGVHETGFHPVVWYRRAFTLDEDDRAGRMVIRFGAVDYKATVWVNGRLACRHEGGNTPFSADITPLLTREGPQFVTVRAEDDPFDLQQPRGKQYWESKPGYIWYHRTTGIWQPVWLEPLPALAIEEIRWTPDLDRFGVGLTLRLDAEPPSGWRVRVRLYGDRPRGVLTDDTYLIGEKELRRDILLSISNAAVRRRRSLIWSPENPNLIDVDIDLIDAEGAVVDQVRSYFGLRRIELDNGYFILNGIPTFLRLDRKSVV